MSQTGASSSTTPAPKTKLKISVTNRQSSVPYGSAAPPPPSAIPASASSIITPSAPLSAKTLIKLRAAKSIKLQSPTSTPAPAAPESPPPTSARTKAGRQTKPTKKIVEASKRDLDDFDDDYSDQPVKKIKLRQNSIRPGPTVRLKHRGRPVVRPLGEGYDSEASDREEDPVIEQQFMIRMLPGEHCDYVRKAIEENRFDPKAPERRLPDISLKFFEESSRRAVLTVMGQRFAAVLVDLPTITESMKTWDRKALLKSADICQMLLVFAPVSSDDQARTAPLPLVVEPGNKWPHGLTPPMHDCVKRRFAKTISRKEIEDKEAEVERLLEEDRKAIKTEWRWYDPTQTEKSKAAAMGSMSEEDAEGEPDDAVTPAPNAEDDDLFDQELQNELENELQTALEQEMAASPDGVKPSTGAAQIPASAAAREESEESEEDESEEDESEDGDDDDDDDDGDGDDEESDEEISEEQKTLRATKEIIADLRRQRALKEAEKNRANLGIMKTRCDNQIRSITQEIKNKLRSIGIEDEEEFDEA